MLSIGIVGLPNVGKSTFFKALTKKQVDISNYPFTTIDPNVGVVAVPDKRLEPLAKIFSSKKIIPTAIEFYDIAGLVKGASQGEGLGNKFLANIREVDAIAHIARVFENEQIAHIHERIDPADDIVIINTELELADIESKERRAKNKEQEGLPPLQLLTNKKVVYVFNISEKQLKDKWQPDEQLLKVVGNSKWVAICNSFELALSELSSEEQKILLEEMGLKESGLDGLIKECYAALDLITFLTTGEDETRAWTAKRETLIPQAARAIHTDFERLFIRADVINWQDLLEIGSWSTARQLGKLRIVGRDYTVQDGDVVEIRIGR